jgi:hypothetical protein
MNFDNEKQTASISFTHNGLFYHITIHLLKNPEKTFVYKRKIAYRIRSNILSGKSYCQSYKTADWLNIRIRDIFHSIMLDKKFIRSNMPHLSFNEKPSGKPISIISEGKYKGEILYSYEEDPIGDKKGLTQVSLPPDCKFEVLPNPLPDKRDVYYIVGASGSGKSYWVKNLILNYRKLFPEREVYLATQLEEDETLDSISPPIKRIRINSFLERPPKIDEFKNTLLICDDFDTLPKPELEALWSVIDMIAIQGRHTNSSLAVISHHIVQSKRTTLIINESNWVVVYPQATSVGNLKYLLEKKYGIDVNQIRQFRRMKTRWVALYSLYPQLYVAEKNAGLLVDDYFE